MSAFALPPIHWVPPAEAIERNGDSGWAEWDRLTAPHATDQVTVREEPKA